VEWYIIEYESDAYPPLVSVEKALEVRESTATLPAFLRRRRQ